MNALNIIVGIPISSYRALITIVQAIGQFLKGPQAAWRPHQTRASRL